MKRPRSGKTSGVSKKRKSGKKSLMKRVDTKIQKAIGKVTEYKIKAATRGEFSITTVSLGASAALAAANFFQLTSDWPATGGTAGLHNTRIGNSLKKCTTYFTLEIRLYLNVGTAASSNFNSVQIRVIIFTAAEVISPTDPIANFFQFNTNQSGVSPYINPTNKGKITVLYDKIITTPLNPAPNAAYAINWPRAHKYIRFSRKFKEVLFDTSGDVTPKRPYRNTFCAAFAHGPPAAGTAVGTLNNVIRYYWLD